MFYAYGITEQGTYHKKQNMVCQDAHNIVKRGDMVFAAVADGLGSEDYSDVASKMAVEISTGHCAEKITTASQQNEILQTIKSSFLLAQNGIEKKALSDGHDINQYDTTLTVAVIRNDTLYYGHSGDSGIIALTTEGLYEKVTLQQRDEDNNVFPLYFKEKWVFGKYEKKVCSVLLATDGILEAFFPVYIRKEPIDVYVALARFFMDNRNLRIHEVGEDMVKEQMKDFIQNIPDAQINDDKTAVVLINSVMESALQADDYYKEPDWAELKRKFDEEWKRQAYPHLFE